LKTPVFQCHFGSSRIVSKRQQHARGGSEAFEKLQEIIDPAVATLDDEDPMTEVNALYRRALTLVQGEFEERTWQAFWLNVVEERSPADVAAELGVTPAAVRKAKSRALYRLKEEAGDLIR
jgi:RNA polymerase sigma-70 factor (ECF subfamily)